MSQVIEAIIELVITTIGVYLFGRIALNKKIEVSKSKFLVFFIITVVCNTIIYLNLTGTLKTILMEIINIIFFVKVFKISMSKSIFLTLIHLLFLVLAELLQFFVITKILIIDVEFCYREIMGSIYSSFISCVLLITITIFIRKLLRFILNTKISSNLKIIIYSIMTLLCTIGLFYKMISEFKISNDIMSYLVSLMMLIVVLIGLIRQAIDNVILS